MPAENRGLHHEIEVDLVVTETRLRGRKRRFGEPDALQLPDLLSRNAEDRFVVEQVVLDRG